MKKKYIFPGTSFWANQPMARLGILLILGCIVGHTLNLQSVTTFLLLGLLCIWLAFLILLFISIRSLKRIRSASHIRGCLIIFLFFFSGLVGVLLFSSPTCLPFRESTLISQSYNFLVEVDDEPKTKQNSISFTAKLKYAIGEQTIYTLHSKSKIQIHTSLPIHIRYRDNLILRGKLNNVPAYSNPNLFNYSKLLQEKGIFSTINCRQADIKILPYHGFSVLRYALNWRESLLTQFNEEVMGKTSKQVASALLLGDRTEMDRDILQLYSSGGIIHILAVSGLHVGLVYQALLFLFSFIPFLSKKRVTTIFIILLLWSYAAMTGFSPSVNRAVAMFTLIAVGEILQRRVSAFNILGTAAFFLILFKPLLITDIGFQLSFAAVWGILSIRPVLDKVKQSRFRIIRWVGIPIVVSIAAQITTAPFVFYSFGTFPVWFLPANIIAVPLSTLLTYLGIVTLLLSKIPFIGFYLLKALGWGIELLNSWAYLIAHLPFAQIGDLYIDIIQLILLIICIVLLFSFLRKRSGKMFLALSTLVLTILIYSQVRNSYEQPKLKRLIFSSRYSLFYQVNSIDLSDIYIVYSSDLMRNQTSKYYSDIWRNLSFDKSTRIHPIPFEKTKGERFIGLIIDTIQTIRPMNSTDRINNAAFIVAEKIPAEVNTSQNLKTYENLIWIPAPWISKRSKDEFTHQARSKGMVVSNFLDTGFIELR